MDVPVYTCASAYINILIFITDATKPFVDPLADMRVGTTFVIHLCCLII